MRLQPVSHLALRQLKPNCKLIAAIREGRQPRAVGVEDSFPSFGSIIRSKAVGAAKGVESGEDETRTGFGGGDPGFVDAEKRDGARIVVRATPVFDTRPTLPQAVVPDLTVRRTQAQPVAEMPHSPLSSPEPSALSDKENQHASSRRVSGQKRPAMEAASHGSAVKKRRMGLIDHDGAPVASGQAAKKRHLEKNDEGKEWYDPDQPAEKRREVRKKMRDMDREITDTRNNLLAPGSTGIFEKFKEANANFRDVKQTTDATIDSKNLNKLVELAVKQASNNTAGGAVGIDIDQFISRSITFMRRGPTEEDAERLYPTGSSQRQRSRLSRRRAADSDAEDDADEGDAMNWEWMGRRAAFPTNKRPAVPMFLLGPLSVQKKIRKVTQRVARQRLNPEDAARPDELKLNEIERDENANLVKLCQNIAALLEKTASDSRAAVEAELDQVDDPTDEQIASIMEKHNVGDDGAVLLCKFAFNPKSFGQTVENLFYISFLIREGKVMLQLDGNGFQTIDVVPSSEKEEVASTDKYQQGVFHLDFDVWEDTCKLFNVQECIIPHRKETSAQDTVKGWYN